MKHINIAFSAGLLLIAGCGKNNLKPDASGNFEADEILISAETSGSLKQWNLEEGMSIQAGKLVGSIDSLQLQLKKQQLTAQIGAVLSRKPDIQSQLAVLQEQWDIAKKEQKRISNLVNAGAATTKQLDDINAQMELISRQINAQKIALNTTSNGLTEETNPIQFQIAQLNDQLHKCSIINPITGTVLANYVHTFELVNAGKPLYKIADLSTLILRGYITGNQLGKIQLGKTVKVQVDDGKGGMKNYDGKVEWVSDKAEFTPKTIQTQDERANLVYAIKIRVKNDGFLKIGMYGEIVF